MWQNIIVFIILGAALFFALRRFWKIAKKNSQPGCGCEGCSGCSEIDPREERKDTERF
jgi:hypothetical protein